MTLARLSLTEDAARALTDEVKRDAEALWAKLLDLYEGKAHEALGYTSWGAYFEEEFSDLGGYARAYQLLNSARVVAALGEGESTVVDRPTERVARELAPVLRQHGEEAVREAWAEITATNPEPTAAQVREHVRLPGPKTADKQARETGLAVLASDGRWHTGRNDPPPHYEAIFRWAEEVARIPDASAIDVPFYADGIDEAARTVRDYLDAFLTRLSQEAAA